MASALVKSSDGEAMPWIRDLTLVGGATALGAPLALMTFFGMTREPWTWAFLIAAGFAGLVSGAALGGLTPRLLRRWLARWPRLYFIGAGLAGGAAWGAAVGAIAGAVGAIAMGEHRMLLPLTGISALLAAPVGALQLGWFWVAAATRRARRRRVDVLVLAAALAAPVLAALSFLPYVF